MASKKEKKRSVFLYCAVEPDLAKWVRAAAEKELRTVSNFIRQKMIELRAEGKK